MKKIILLSFAVSCILGLSAQSQLNGSYLSESGLRITICNDKFYYILEQCGSVAFATDTLAQCTLQQIDDFIELNSENIIETGQRGEFLIQQLDKTIIDSIMVSFVLSCKRDMEIELLPWKHSMPLTTNIYKTSSSEGLLIKLPLEVTSFSYIIRPQNLVLSLYDGVLHSIVSYSPAKGIAIKEGCNRVSVHLPAIDDAFFDREYIVGEYARMRGDTLTWRGQDFIKDKF